MAALRRGASLRLDPIPSGFDPGFHPGAILPRAGVFVCQHFHPKAPCPDEKRHVRGKLVLCERKPTYLSIIPYFLR
jgi:hypothetical protein